MDGAAAHWLLAQTGRPSPGSTGARVDVKVSVRIVLQAANGSVLTKECQHRVRIATDAEIDRITRQMV